MACGNCQALTSQTTLNLPYNDNGVFWYYTQGYSFGFSDTSNINQDFVDIQDPTNELRLSWNIDNTLGGSRAGAYSTSGGEYTRYIFMKYGSTRNFFNYL